MTVLDSLRRRRRSPRKPAGANLLEAFAQVHPRAFFIEIGSNDGEQHDHLRPFVLSGYWSGIMVEPVPYVFERLARNYGAIDRVTLERAAIGERNGAVPFYYLIDATASERERLPDWYDGIGSLRKDFVLGHHRDIPDVERRLVSTVVPSLTFDSLCAKHRVSKVDLLVIDTEGYDWDLLQTINLEMYGPKLVIYEHFHLSPDARAEAERAVRQSGYRTMEEGFDTYCLSDSAEPRLHEVWGGLEPTVPGLSVHDP